MLFLSFCTACSEREKGGEGGEGGREGSKVGSSGIRFVFVLLQDYLIPNAFLYIIPSHYTTISLVRTAVESNELINPLP